MLAKRPEDRFQNPSELMAALIAVSEQLGETYPQVSLPVGWTARPAPATWFRRHAPWAVPGALLLLSVLVLGIVWHRQQPAPAFPELQIKQSNETEAAEPGETGQSTRTTSDDESDSEASRSSL